MASYLGRNVNLALLIIIIGVVVALVGTTVFFQRGLQNRTEAYESTTTTLSQCQTALVNYQERYTQAQQKVNETAQDIRKYDQLYEQKTGELKDTQTQLSQTQKDLTFQTLQAQKFKQFYEDEARRNGQLNQTLAYQQSQINDLNRKVDNLQDDLDACESSS